MPSAVLVLPIFLELNAVHLIGTTFSIVLPFAFFPFGVYLGYIYYATALPPGLLEAARVDGCGEWAAFRRVGIPLAKPVVALVFFFSFVANWNNFFLPYVFLSNERQLPIQVGLSAPLQIFAAGRCARDARRDVTGRGRVRRVAASPRTRAGRRRDQGVMSGEPARGAPRSRRDGFASAGAESIPANGRTGVYVPGEVWPAWKTWKSRWLPNASQSTFPTWPCVIPTWCGKWLRRTSR